ncbi:MAG: SpoIIE family protein phosphatase [Candidatus Omnitrophica bacterium]|nr:SpoIIE family protein phosphatase [Candidatus Omnitrophota bacterium]
MSFTILKFLRYRKFKLSLKFKYILYVAITTLLFSFILISVFLYRFQKGNRLIVGSVEESVRQAITEQIQKRIEIVIDTLAKDLINPLYFVDAERMREIIQPIRKMEDVEYVYIFDKDGKIITDGTGRNLFYNLILDDPISKKAVNTEKLLLQWDKGKEILDASLPIFLSEGKKIGGVRIGFMVKKIEEEISGSKNKIVGIITGIIKSSTVLAFVISIIFVALGMLFSLYISNLLVKPILKLTEAVKEFGRGNIKTKVYINTKDELEDLAFSFNQMADDLAKREEELIELNLATKRLATYLETDSLLREALEAIKKLIKASKGSVMLLENNYLAVKANFGWKPGEIVRKKSFAIGEGIAGEVLRKKTTILANDVNNHPLFKREDNKIWFGCRHLLCVPLVYENTIKGVINIQDKINNQTFNQRDIEYAEVIASSVALALSNIDLIQEKIKKTQMEHELKLASSVQAMLLSRQDPEYEAIKLASFYDSATETGGDWYGYLEDRNSQKLTILIGDVSGHGVAAALITAVMDSFFKTVEVLKERHLVVNHNQILYEPLSPANILRLLNKIIFDIGARKIGVTFFVSTFDFKEKTITFANAGHNPPYLYRPIITEDDFAVGIKRNLNVLISKGIRLGDESEVDFEERKMKIKEGDLLFWFTDGVVDMEDSKREIFGEKRLEKILVDSANLEVSQIKEIILNNLYNFLGGREKKDDIAFIVGKIT